MQLEPRCRTLYALVSACTVLKSTRAVSRARVRLTSDTVAAASISALYVNYSERVRGCSNGISARASTSRSIHRRQTAVVCVSNNTGSQLRVALDVNLDPTRAAAVEKIVVDRGWHNRLEARTVSWVKLGPKK